MAITKIHPIKSTLRSALTYVLEGKKTNEGLLISSFACSPETADIEFRFTLSQCMQKGNNLAFHIIQSFKPGETDAETAHKIGDELAMGFLKGNYEFVLSTHVDRGHIHNHLIFCAANFVDYRKFVSNRKSYYQIRKISDKSCEDHGLSIVDPVMDRGKSYKEYMADKEGNSWKRHLQGAVDLALYRSLSYDEFLMKLHILGVEVRESKDLALRHAGDQRYIRAESLGYRYTVSRIKERIADQYLGEDTPKKRVRNRNNSMAFHELKLTEKALAFIAEHGIDTYSALEQNQEALHSSLRITKDELRRLERKINEITEIIKQLKVLESHRSSRSYIGETSLEGRAVAKAAKDFLKGKGIKEPFPPIKPLEKEQATLRNQLEGLYQKYGDVQRDLKKIQAVRRQIDRALEKSPLIEL